MVAAKSLVIAAAALAFLIPERVSAAGVSAGTFAGGIASGITALGTIKIAPVFSPDISPRVVPEIGIRTDFPEWLDPKDLWGGLTSLTPRIVTKTTVTKEGVVIDDPEVVEVVAAGTPEVEVVEVAIPDPEDDPYEG
jgi:hypothetical protein